MDLFPVKFKRALHRSFSLRLSGFPHGSPVCSIHCHYSTLGYYRHTLPLHPISMLPSLPQVRPKACAQVLPLLRAHIPLLTYCRGTIKLRCALAQLRTAVCKGTFIFWNYSCFSTHMVELPQALPCKLPFPQCRKLTDTKALSHWPVVVQLLQTTATCFWAYMTFPSCSSVLVGWSKLQESDLLHAEILELLMVFQYLHGTFVWVLCAGRFSLEWLGGWMEILMCEKLLHYASTYNVLAKCADT